MVSVFSKVECQPSSYPGYEWSMDLPDVDPSGASLDGFCPRSASSIPSLSTLPSLTLAAIRIGGIPSTHTWSGLVDVSRRGPASIGGPRRRPSTATTVETVFRISSSTMVLADAL